MKKIEGKVALKNFFLIFMLVIFLIVVKADVVSINSGGSEQIIINPDEYIEGFFSSSNSAPSVSNVILNSTSRTNSTIENLTCYGIITDFDGDAIDVTVRWYKNDALDTSVFYDGNYSTGTFFNTSFDASNTAKGEEWICSLMTDDGTVQSPWVNSSVLTIKNSPPTVTLGSPGDGEVITSRTPEFSWTGNDRDSDGLTYQLNLTVFGSCACADTRNITEAGQTHTVTDYLKCLNDKGCYYNWSVRAHDVEEYGNWTEIRVLRINSLISIILINDTISFGSLGMNELKNTTTDNPHPFVIQNDGNCFNNITINASSLWESAATNSEYYKFKADNKTLEKWSFNWALSQTSFAQMPVEGSASIMFVELNWTNATDSAEIDVLVQVPPAEAAGNRESIVELTAVLGE